MLVDLSLIYIFWFLDHMAVMCLLNSILILVIHMFYVVCKVSTASGKQGEFLKKRQGGREEYMYAYKYNSYS